MRQRTREVGLGLIALWAAAALGFAGCGSDENGGGGDPTIPDASPDTSTTSGDDASASAADVTVYTGTTAQLDASQSVGATFAWTVKSVPQGSAVTTASLQAAASARPSFVPDVSGDYQLEVAVTNGGATATKAVSVRAVPAPIFYMLTNAKEQPPYYEVRTVGMDGTGAHAVTCRLQPPNDGGADGGDNASLLLLSMLTADFGLDWWEAPPGQPSRAAFQEFQYGPDASALYLSVGTTDSTCQTPPKQVRAVSNVALDGGKNNPGILHPRFSPNGQRIAYIEQRPDGYFVSVIGYDGKDYREIAPLCHTAEGSDCWKGALFPPRPQWLDDQTVAWARIQEGTDGGVGWELMKATDGPAPAPAVHMTCPGTLPFGIGFLRDGSILANRRIGSSGQDLWVLRPTAPGGVCQEVRNLTNLPNAKAYARDFSISPDGTQVAFIRYVEPPDAGDAGSISMGGEVYVADVSGATPPRSVATPPQQAWFGPRYIARGAYLSYNGLAPLPDGAIEDAGLEGGATELLDGGLPAITVIPVGGGPVRYAAVSDLRSQTFVTGGGNGGACGFNGFNCAIAAPGASLAGALGSVGLVGLLVARRRRRR